VIPSLWYTRLRCPFCGSGGDKQRLGDFGVGQSFGGEPRDTQLARGQGVAAGDRVAPGLGARGDQFRARPSGDPPCPAAVGEIQRSLQLNSRLHSAASAPQRRAIVS
jgi:hypothetical protein